jgi:hypothetical protein
LRDEKAGVPTKMLALRCLANMFSNSTSQFVLLKKRQHMVEAVTPFIYSDNKSIRQAAITVLLK